MVVVRGMERVSCGYLESRHPFHEWNGCGGGVEAGYQMEWGGLVQTEAPRGKYWMHYVTADPETEQAVEAAESWEVSWRSPSRGCPRGMNARKAE
jgi:hypothetical protein